MMHIEGRRSLLPDNVRASNRTPLLYLFKLNISAVVGGPVSEILNFKDFKPPSGCVVRVGGVCYFVKNCVCVS